MKNYVSLIGHVGNDVKNTQFENGQASNFSLATNESYKNAQGEKETKTTWHNVVAFGKTAELINNYVKKGDLVNVEGKIQYRTYDDKDGNKQNIAEIVVNKILFLSSKDKEEISED